MLFVLKRNTDFHCANVENPGWVFEPIPLEDLLFFGHEDRNKLFH